MGLQRRQLRLLLFAVLVQYQHRGRGAIGALRGLQMDGWLREALGVVYHVVGGGTHWERHQAMSLGVSSTCARIRDGFLCRLLKSGNCTHDLLALSLIHI